MPKNRSMTHLTKRQEPLGTRLQTALDAFDGAVTARPLGAGLLGAGLALVVVIGGFAAFIVVWALLVGVIH